jgi:hypothetical protein
MCCIISFMFMHYFYVRTCHICVSLQLTKEIGAYLLHVGISKPLQNYIVGHNLGEGGQCWCATWHHWFLKVNQLGLCAVGTTSDN